MRLIGGAALAATALFVLVGCAGAPESASTPTVTAVQSEAPESTPTPIPTPTEVGIDRTYEARAAGGGIVAKAVEEPVGTITIYTDVASPYGDAQEVSRSEAVVACEAVRASMEASVVLVFDAGDEPFVIFNGSNFPNCAVK